MTPTDLYQLFIAGKDLPALGTRQARSLLDLCRSKLLAMGRRVKPSSASDPDDIKTELLQAHRELVGGEPVYNSAGPQETRTIEEAEQCLAMLKAINATKKPSGITAAAARPPVKAPATTATATPTKAPVRPAAAPAPSRPTPPAKATARPPGKLPTPAHLVGTAVDHAALAARAALQAAVRRPAAVAPKPAPRPLQDLPAGELVRLATHKFAKPADAAAARAELGQRPEISFLPNGSYTVAAIRKAK